MSAVAGDRGRAWVRPRSAPWWGGRIFMAGEAGLLERGERALDIGLTVKAGISTATSAKAGL